jgi:hypothetical protein
MRASTPIVVRISDYRLVISTGLQPGVLERHDAGRNRFNGFVEEEAVETVHCELRS